MSVESGRRSQTRSRSNSEDAIIQNGESPRDKKVTTATVTRDGLGSRQMTLYLSRTTSMLKPGSASPQNEYKADDNKTKKDSLTVTNGQTISHTAFQREFTFTGYDIMADSKYHFHSILHST